MTLVNVSEISAGLFITGALFILLFFSLLSFGVLQCFKKHVRSGLFSFAAAIVSGVVFGIILDQWYV